MHADAALSVARPDLSGRFCAAPFDAAEIHQGGALFLCCPTWLPTRAGTVGRDDLLTVYNSDQAQAVRRSILDGSFRYCDARVCPLIQEGLLPKASSITDTRHLQIIRDGVVSGLEPRSLNLCYDESCNLSCPSCRNNVISFTKGSEYKQRKAIQDRLVRYAFGAPHERRLSVTITGSGDPFGSRLFRELLFSIDGARYPNVTINLHTNGVAFTETAWRKMARIHRNLRTVMVSVDAGNQHDYQVTRRGGNWPVLLQNLEFLGRMRADGRFVRFELNLIVQRDNYRGIPEFVRLGQRVGADACNLSLIADWGTWTVDQFAARAIWRTDHPEFEQFLDVMRDPALDAPIVFFGNTRPYRDGALRPSSNGPSRLPQQ